MKKSKKVLLIVFSFLCHSLLYSSPADTASIIDNIYNYNFLKASEQLSRLSEKDPLMSETLNLEIRWWMSVERENDDKFSEFLNTLNRFEKTGNNDLTEIISSTYRMRYYACTNKIYLIPFLFLKIQRQIDIIDIKRPEYSSREGSELFILYKSFLALIRNNFFINKYFSDSEMNQELIGEIENVIRNGYLPNRTIGRYFLMKYYFEIEKDNSKALTHLAELHRQYPNNKIFSQLLTN